MFVIVFECPIKLQNGLLYPRVEMEQRIHSGDEIEGNVMTSIDRSANKAESPKVISLIKLPFAKLQSYHFDKTFEKEHL